MTGHWFTTCQTITSPVWQITKHPWQLAWITKHPSHSPTCKTTSTSYEFPLLFWWPLKLEPLYSSEVTTPGCCVFIGGGGISEAVDTKAAAGESLRYPAGTGMAPTSLAQHQPWSMAVWAKDSVGVYEEVTEDWRGPTTSKYPLKPLQFGLTGTQHPEK